ncbi:MAG: glycerol kinase GlpK [Bacteriovoracia bacterium]
MKTKKTQVKKDLILAIDEGTTGSTAMLVNEDLKVKAIESIDFRQIYPKPGWVEHNLDDIWKATSTAIQRAIKKVPGSAKKIAAIGITNQRETSCFWSKSKKTPLCNAIVWQDRRTAEYCNVQKMLGHESFIQSRTGLLLDPYFSGTKVHWALENIQKVKRASGKQDLAFGTIDSYLVFKLTNGKSFVTEPSNASRTLLFNIHQMSWDDELLKLFGIPRSCLPEVKDSNAHFGETSKVPGLPDGIPIYGILGDQQAALLGQACIHEGMAKCTYGTGAFILMNTGNTPRSSSARLLSTVAWQFNGKTTYALEGGAFTAGASVQWVRDELKFIKKSEDIERLACSVDSSGEVMFVPAFTGIGAPYWKPDARAAFFGITRGSTRAHMARAVLEGIALMNVDILTAMEKDLGSKMKSLNVDGGASMNNFLMQFQADVLGVDLIRPKMIETTSLGAIFAAGLGVGFWSSLDEIVKSWKKDRNFKPKMKIEEKNRWLSRWHEIIGRVS